MDTARCIITKHCTYSESTSTNSHRNMGWEKFTDRIIEILNEREKL